MKSLTLAVSLSLLSSAAFSYEICGNSNDGFVLKCNDGHTNTSTYPPNHNAATEICADHGGIAAGYPRAILKTAKADQQALSSCPGNGGANHNTSRPRLGKQLDKASPMMRKQDSGAQDYNSSRSNT